MGEYRTAIVARDGLLCDGRLHFDKHASSDDRFLTACLVIALFSDDEFADYKRCCPRGAVITIRPCSDESILNEVESVDGLHILAVSNACYAHLLFVAHLVLSTALAR